ncbi:MAG TPA: NB-ARC domain-containing protein [Pseudonocardiaceae bacterium]|nr:NB-ARC domain-containing protein [Pseudonocardiaceae bacterium]
MSDDREIRQEISGTVAGHVIQADTINGGVTIYGAPARDIAVAEEVPEPPRHYTNFRPQLNTITDRMRPAVPGAGPNVEVIVGQPGSGRTGLACKWVAEHSPDYPDGNYFAQLAEETDAYQILADWLTSYFGYSYQDLPPGLAGVRKLWRSKTKNKRVLIVVDDASRYEDVEVLLPGQGESAVLVVSVDELTRFVTEHAVRPIELTPLGRDQALALLGTRIGRDRVATEPAAAAELAEICDWSPTPLNIVAALLAIDPHLTIVEQVKRLKDQGVLTQLGLNVVYDAAYDRLAEDGKQAYRALGAHPGKPMTIRVEAVAAALGIDVDAARRALDTLFTASLAGKPSSGGYRLSSLVAEHAAAKAGVDLAALRSAFIAYYRDYGLRCAEKLIPNRGWWRGMTPVEDREVALRWLIDNGPAIVVAADAAMAVGDYRSVVLLCLVGWPLDTITGNPARMVRLNQLGVKAANALGDDLFRSVTHTQLGFGYRDQRNWAGATEVFEIAMTLGTPESKATAVEALGLMHRNQGQPERALPLLTENLQLAREILDADPDDPVARRRHRMARFHLATVLEPAAAVPELRQVLAEFTKAGDERNQAKINYRLGLKLTEGGDGPAAIEPLRIGADLAEANKMILEQGLCHRALADADPADAESHLRTASRILRGHFPEEDAEVRARMTELGFTDQP